MKLEIKEGMQALAIVLGIVVAIAGIVYVANFGKRKESTIVPSTLQPTITIKVPTVMPLIKETTSSAFPNPTKKVQTSTETVTPTVERITVTPIPAI